MSHSRREFVTSAGIVAGAAVAASTTIASASTSEPPARAGQTTAPAGQQATTTGAPARQIVPGSPSPMYSRAVRLDRIVFVAGVVAHKPGTREVADKMFDAQARQTLENLKASVEAAGSKLDKVLKCNVYLTDSEDFAAFNRIYAEYFPKDPPARSTVVVKQLVVPDAKLEVDCVTCVD